MHTTALQQPFRYLSAEASLTILHCAWWKLRDAILNRIKDVKKSLKSMAVNEPACQARGSYAVTSLMQSLWHSMLPSHTLPQDAE